MKSLQPGSSKTNDDFNDSDDAFVFKSPSQKRKLRSESPISKRKKIASKIEFHKSVDSRKDDLKVRKVQLNKSAPSSTLRRNPACRSNSTKTNGISPYFNDAANVSGKDTGSTGDLSTVGLLTNEGKGSTSADNCVPVTEENINDVSVVLDPDRSKTIIDGVENCATNAAIKPASDITNNESNVSHSSFVNKSENSTNSLVNYLGLKTANTANCLVCPLCKKKFEKSAQHVSHMKQCAKKKKISTAELLRRIELSKNDGRSLANCDMSKTEPGLSGEIAEESAQTTYDLALAAAISLSMSDASRPGPSTSLSAVLDKRVVDAQRATLERFGFTSSASSGTHQATRKRRIKRCGNSVLQTRTAEERTRLLTEKAAVILLSEPDQATSVTVATSSQSTKSEPKESHLTTTQAKKLWQLGEIEVRGSWYVDDLKNYISPEKTPSRVDDKAKLETSSSPLIFPDDDQQSDAFNLAEIKPGVDSLHHCKTETSSPPLTASSSVQNVTAQHNPLADDWAALVGRSEWSDIAIETLDGSVPVHSLVMRVRCPSLQITELVSICRSMTSATIIMILKFIYAGILETTEDLDLEDSRKLASVIGRPDLIKATADLTRRRLSSGSSAEMIPSSISPISNNDDVKFAGRGFEDIENNCDNITKFDGGGFENIENNCDNIPKFLGGGFEDTENNSNITSKQHNNNTNCMEISNGGMEVSQDFIAGNWHIRASDNPKGNVESHKIIDPLMEADTVPAEGDAAEVVDLTQNESPEDDDDNGQPYWDKVCRKIQENIERATSEDCLESLERSVEYAKIQRFFDERNSHQNEINDIPEVDQREREKLFNMTQNSEEIDLFAEPDVVDVEPDQAPEVIDVTRPQDEPLQLPSTTSIRDSRVASTDSEIKEVPVPPKAAAELIVVSSDSEQNGNFDDSTDDDDDETQAVAPPAQSTPTRASELPNVEPTVTVNPEPPVPVESSPCRYDEEERDLFWPPENEYDVFEYYGQAMTPDNAQAVSQSLVTSVRSPRTPRRILDRTVSPAMATLSPTMQSSAATSSRQISPDFNPIDAASSSTPAGPLPEKKQRNVSNRRRRSSVIVHSRLVRRSIRSLNERGGRRRSRVSAIRAPTAADVLSATLIDALDETWQEAAIAPATPNMDCRPFVEVTPRFTPNTKMVDAVTPPPNFSAMKTVSLKKNLGKYGLKTSLGKVKARKILKHFYDELHPIVNTRTGKFVKFLPSNGISPSLSRGQKPTRGKRGGGRGRGGHAKSQTACPVVEKRLPGTSHRSTIPKKDFIDLSDGEGSNSDCSDDADEFEGLDEEILTQGRPAALTVEEAVRKYIYDHPEVHTSILMYKPIWVEAFRKDLQAYLNAKYKLADIMDYLDKQCIVIRRETQAANTMKRNERRKNRKNTKKKTAALSQKIHAT